MCKGRHWKNSDIKRNVQRLHRHIDDGGDMAPILTEHDGESVVCAIWASER